MGGYGSGGWNSKGKREVESCPSVNISTLRRQGILEKGVRGNWHWGDNRIAFETRWEDMIVLTWSEEGQSREQFLGFQWYAHPRKFGGHQVYFLCPLCARRVTLLYFAHGRFGCRVCHRLTYGSQKENVADRLRRKLEKISARLESAFEWGVTEPPERPTGMHQRTYKRLAAAFAQTAAFMYHLDCKYTQRQLGI